MRAVEILPPPAPAPEPRVEVVDESGCPWIVVRRSRGRFEADGRAIHLLTNDPFFDLPLQATTLTAAVVEARKYVADRLYRLAGEIDCPDPPPAADAA